jgi:hypothetical protein
MDDQKISPVEELAQGFTAVTLEIVDKPPDELLVRPKTPRAFTDRDRECYYVTTDCGSSDDERNGAKPPEPGIPVDAHRDSAAAFVASPLTCYEESLCTKSRRITNETFVQTISMGAPGHDSDLRVMFDAKLPRTLISYEAANDAALDPSGSEKFVGGPHRCRLERVPLHRSFSGLGRTHPLAEGQGRGVHGVRQPDNRTAERVYGVPRNGWATINCLSAGRNSTYGRRARQLAVAPAAGPRQPSGSGQPDAVCLQVPPGIHGEADRTNRL